MRKIIVATSRNSVIGNQGKLPWHLPRDLKYFKEKTKGHTIIMGRKTFESIGKPLPGRNNVVISKTLENILGCTVIDSLEKALMEYKDCFIIGGQEIYRQSLELDMVDQIYLTLVDCNVTGDAFFKLPEEWSQKSGQCYERDENNIWPMEFRIYEK